MARLAGGQAAPELPIHNDASAHTGAQGYHGEVPGPFSRAAEELAHGSAVRVVPQQQRQIQMLAKQLFQRNIFHRDVGGEEHIASVHRPGQANAHPPDLLLDDLFGQLRQGPGKMFRSLKVQGNPLYLYNAARLVHQTRL